MVVCTSVLTTKLISARLAPARVSAESSSETSRATEGALPTGGGVGGGEGGLTGGEGLAACVGFSDFSGIFPLAGQSRAISSAGGVASGGVWMEVEET